MPLQTTIFIFGILCCQISIVLCGLYPQYTMYYNSNPPGVGCSGSNYEHSFNSFNMTNGAVNLRPRGIWHYDFYLAGNLISSIFTATDGSICSTDMINDRVVARKVLDADLDDSGIVFVMATTSVYTATTANELSYLSAVNFTTIVFTGLESYTIFSGINYSGNATCLRTASSVIEKGYGMSILDQGALVGSFRRGCTNTVQEFVEADETINKILTIVGNGMERLQYIDVNKNTDVTSNDAHTVEQKISKKVV